MIKIFMPLWLLFFSTATAQNIVIHINDSLTRQALPGVRVFINEEKRSFVSDQKGFTSISLKPGIYEAQLMLPEYKTKRISFKIPVSDTLFVLMEPLLEQAEEVIVSSTRTSRTIRNVPTRVEIISSEELDEKTNMRPSNVSMVLHESTGILVQQTSAVSGSAGIRMQGMDGRYTQLLKDGYPDYGDFAGGLSILEIPPGDLSQVEVIKGPASTLYGGGAMAGVINFISKKPEDTPERSFLLNQSHIGQTNLSAYLSDKNKKAGYTFFIIGNRQLPYDADGDAFTDIPRSTDITVHPRLYLYAGKRATVSIGNSFTQGKIRGGDMQAVNLKSDSLHTWFEENKTRRNTSNLEYELKIRNNSRFILKTSYTFFSRSIELNDYKFSGSSKNFFSDISYSFKGNNQFVIIGLNYNSSIFLEKGNEERNFYSHVSGLYLQHTWDISSRLKIENGLRIDLASYENKNYQKREYFPLPKISALYRFTDHLSSRMGGGLGYKIPTLFTSETESLQYRHISALSNIISERSIGATYDLDYKGPLSKDVYITLNQLFFYTRVNDPTILVPGINGIYHFENANSPLASKGLETNLKMIFRHDIKFFAGYTFTDARALYSSIRTVLPLQPRHRLNLALVYEKEKWIKIGLESYLTGKQYLTNGSKTPATIEFGFMAEKIFKHFSIFINLENFTDVKQGNYSPVVTGSPLHPEFNEIWTHTEGFIFNGGVKLKL
jgi:outer membrane receptor for ferrienterochelin and colicins